MKYPKKYQWWTSNQKLARSDLTGTVPENDLLFEMVLGRLSGAISNRRRGQN